MSDPEERARELAGPDGRVTQAEPTSALATADPTGAPAQGRVIVLAIAAVGVLLSLFQLYSAGIEPLSLFYQRPIHLAFIMVLTFLMFPAFGKRRGALGWAIDAVFLAAAVASGWYIVANLDAIFARAGFWSQTDIWMGILTTVTVLEASRRAIGLPMTIIGAVAIVYALAGSRGALPWLGDWLPGIMEHRGNSLDRLVGQLYLGQEGIYGLPLGVAATYIFVFVLFGAFLEVTGAGKFFIDLAYAATGRKPGGPAKAAVLASAGMGSISGSAIANVVTTGAFTIPLMKRLGYKPAQAGGIEAAASTGGQITPPLMGAGAFLISEYTRVPYVDIVLVSIYPAILYLGTVYLFVHIVAMKRGMEGMPADELPSVSGTLKAGWQFVLPLFILVWLLVQGFSPMRVGFWAIISVAVVAFLRRTVEILVLEPRHGEPVTAERLTTAIRSGLSLLVQALVLGSRNAVAVSMACAIAGIIVGVVGLTGLGLKFSSMMIAFSGGNLVLALILVLIASLILGMGLPVTASYIVLIVLVGPALTSEFGIPLLIAHLVVFWYSQDSNVTPPIALAAFAGAALAGSKPLETTMQAWKYAKGLYLIPVFMVYNPELILGGSVPYVIWTGAIAALALAAFAAAIEGYLFAPMGIVARILIIPATIAVFHPSFAVETVGALTLAAILLANRFTAGRTRSKVGAGFGGA